MACFQTQAAAILPYLWDWQLPLDLGRIELCMAMVIGVMSSLV